MAHLVGFLAGSRFATGTGNFELLGYTSSQEEKIFLDCMVKSCSYGSNIFV